MKLVLVVILCAGILLALLIVAARVVVAFTKNVIGKSKVRVLCLRMLNFFRFTNDWWTWEMNAYYNKRNCSNPSKYPSDDQLHKLKEAGDMPGELEWITQHIATCKECARRFASICDPYDYDDHWGLSGYGC